jgi:two-component system cell cycle sensor histidine kinase/response regulator CckA
MHHARIATSFATEPSARVTYDALFSNLVENLAGGESILLVDDDDHLRIRMQRVLEDFGYQVLVARDGHEALAVSDAYDGTLALILSEVVMPGLSGVDIVKRVQRRFNAAVALFMSGHLGHALLEDGVLRNGTQFLQKPFAPDALARKVREILDRSPVPTADGLVR